MATHRPPVTLWLLVPVFGLILALSCQSSAAPSSALAPQTRGFEVGVAPVPKHFPGESSDWQEMLDLLPQVAETVTVQSPWRDGPSSSGQIPSFIQLLGDRQALDQLTPCMGINFFHQAGTFDPDLVCGTGQPNDWSNPAAQEEYQRTALAIASRYHPPYFALALEVNEYALAHPADFERFLDFYLAPGGLYDCVKSVSPRTKVFVTFQLELMKGLGGWGFPVHPHWDLIARFGGKLDLLAFTTYPQLDAGVATPEAIPARYYGEIRDHSALPIAFVEIGWSTVSSAEQAAQARFVPCFLALAQDLQPLFVNWVFMHDIHAPGGDRPLDYTGLRTFQGEPKLAWRTWKGLKETPRS